MLPGTSAEVAYNALPPEVINCSDEGAELADSISSKIPSHSWKRRVVGTLVFLLIAALAIGLGIGLRKVGGISSSPPAEIKSVAIIAK